MLTWRSLYLLLACGDALPTPPIPLYENRAENPLTAHSHIHTQVFDLIKNVISSNRFRILSSNIRLARLAISYGVSSSNALGEPRKYNPPTKQSLRPDAHQRAFSINTLLNLRRHPRIDGNPTFKFRKNTFIKKIKWTFVQNQLLRLHSLYISVHTRVHLQYHRRYKAHWQHQQHWKNRSERYLLSLAFLYGSTCLNWWGDILV